MRRAVVVSAIGLLVVVVLVWFLPWGLAVVAAGTPPRSPSAPACSADRCAAPVTGRGHAGTPPGDNG
jgi:hypothetical protein